jgi:hypothetical protein
VIGGGVRAGTQAILHPHRDGVMQDAEYELPRIHIPRTWVNKPPINAPDTSGWHHAHGVDPLKKTRVGKVEEEATVSAEEKNKALVRRFLEALDEENLGAIE